MSINRETAPGCSSPDIYDTKTDRIAGRKTDNSKTIVKPQFLTFNNSTSKQKISKETEASKTIS